MIMPRSLTLFVAILFMGLVPALAPYGLQAQTYSYRTYDETSGLPGSYLSVIEQDKSGLLWIGLETGLYRYDGFEFYPVVLPDTLSGSYPNALYCDTEGTMWVGMTDGSLYTWSPGRMIARKTVQESDRINRIIAGPDKKVWIITQTKGVYIGCADGL